MKKKRHAAVLVCSAISIAVAGFAVTAAIAARPMPLKVNPVADGGAVNTAAAAAGLNYATGFEATDLPPYLTLGYMAHVDGFFPAGCGSTVAPCWGHTTGAGFSLITPTIDNVHPALGIQHLRVVHDPSTRTNIPNFGLGVDARFPRTAHLSARPIDVNFVSVDVSVSNAFGQDFRVQPQSNSQGFLATSALFHYSGALYILDDLCDTVGLSFFPAGFWDTTGGYQNYTVAMNPCNNTINYSYGGAQVYAGCVIAGSNLEQFLVFGDNYPGSLMDVDNVFLTSGDGPCPCICGNNIVEFTCGDCDGTADANCPGRCIPPGQPGECTCWPVCTFDNPCPLVNGVNPAIVSSTGFYTYSGGSPFISVNGCGNSYDAALQVMLLSDPNTVLAFNDDCNAGPYGSGSDPSAPCYEGASPNQSGSCTCFANPGAPVLIRASRFTGADPATGSTTQLNIRKKGECVGASVGSCCDTNGADAGCTDNVTAANCVGFDKVWTDQGKCPTTPCACIPLCAGLQCGDDGCGGSCGVCGDNLVCNGVDTCDAAGQCNTGPVPDCNDGVNCTVDACNEPAGVCTHALNHAACGNNNVCDGIEMCTLTGCVPGGVLIVDDGVFCNGVETCDPINGQTDGPDPCVPETEVCDEVKDQCEPGVIPTVSQWGLVALTLMLLVAAKVQFPGNRRVS
jgi:hypothetical protein